MMMRGPPFSGGKDVTSGRAGGVGTGVVGKLVVVEASVGAGVSSREARSFGERVYSGSLGSLGASYVFCGSMLGSAVSLLVISVHMLVIMVR